MNLEQKRFSLIQNVQFRGEKYWMTIGTLKLKIAFYIELYYIDNQKRRDSHAVHVIDKRMVLRILGTCTSH